jgi:hypothetical protein
LAGRREGSASRRGQDRIPVLAVVVAEAGVELAASNAEVVITEAKAGG